MSFANAIIAAGAFADVLKKVELAAERLPSTLAEIQRRGGAGSGGGGVDANGRPVGRSISGGDDILDARPTLPGLGAGLGASAAVGASAGSAAANVNRAISNADRLKNALERKNGELLKGFIDFSLLAGYAAQIAELQQRLFDARPHERSLIRLAIQQILRDIITRYGNKGLRHILGKLKSPLSGPGMGTDILTQYRSGAA